MIRTPICLMVLIAAAIPVPVVAAPPALSISIDDGRSTVGQGDQVDYRVRLRNDGAEPLTGLVVTQSLPAGSRFAAATPAGAVAGERVSWTVSAPARQVTVLTASATVGAPPPALTRFPSTACVYPAGDRTTPLACATDSNALANTTQAASAESSAAWGYWLAGGLAVIVAAGALVFSWRRRGAGR